VEAVAQDLVHAALDNGTTDNVTVVVAEASPGTGGPSGPESGHPTIVGAAAAQPRRGGMLGRALFRRQSDTGELEAIAEQPLDPEELRYLPRAPRRHAGLRRAVFLLVPLLLVVAALVGAYTWTQHQYHVSNDGEFVAIYKGVQMDLPGVDLSSVHETDTLKVADLPEFNQQQVRDGIVADSYADAQRIVGNLQEQLQEKCDAAKAAQQAEKKRQQQLQAKKDSNKKKKQQSGQSGGARNSARNSNTTELPSGCEDLP
jgi:protein phosphatase